MNPAEVITSGAAAAIFAKVLTDVVKLSPLPSPAILLPFLALAFSELSAFLLAMANNATFDRPTVAITILVGIAATTGAMGATALQNKSNEPSIK